jgi:hypothetical protein
MSKIQLARSKAIVLLRNILRAACALKLRKYPNLGLLLKELAGSESAAIDLSDAVVLYEAVIQRRPQYLFELGPGSSTAIIALAISEIKKSDQSNNPVFVAIEEDEKWLSYHEKNFPPHLRQFVQLIHRPTVGKVIDGVNCAAYSGIPSHPYDFIHLDSPNFWKHDARVSSDLIELAPTLSPACIVIFDGRQETAHFNLKYLPNFSMTRNRFSLNPEFRISSP